MIIFEIGVGDTRQTRCFKYFSESIDNKVQCFLFEPNPYLFSNLELRFSKYKNVHLNNCAVGAETKTVDLCLAGSSSYVHGIISPELVYRSDSNEILEKISIQMKDISSIDNGDIDVLLLDCEGGEWDIIRSMVSRPKFISVEMYSFGVKYTNPYFDQIEEWMKNNNYDLIKQHEDFYYKKKISI